MIDTDSLEYEFLEEAAREAPATGAFIELGVRRGGGIQKMMQQDNTPGRTYIGIDPYGNIEYSDRDGVVMRHDYTNDMRDQAMQDLYQWAHANNKNFIMLLLEDTEYFERFEDYVPVYSDQEKYIEEEYAVVHYDGPHDTMSIMKEIEWFDGRCPVGSWWVFDDIGNYNHAAIDAYVRSIGFEVVRQGQRKMSYKRATNPARVVVLNLSTRADRLEHMKTVIHGMPLPAKVIPAVDGKTLDEKDTHEQGYWWDTNWNDPILNTDIKRGEIGCAITHMAAWQLAYDTYSPVLVLEDDVEWAEGFSAKDLEQGFEWIKQGAELVYCSYNTMHESKTAPSENFEGASHPYYPYWGSGYIISPQGAEKLLSTDYKQNIIPVDEYLPLMCGHSPLGVPGFEHFVAVETHYDRLKKYPKLDMCAYPKPIINQISRSKLGSDIENDN